MPTALDVELERVSDADLVAYVIGGRATSPSAASHEAAAALLTSCAGLADLASVGGGELAERLARAHVPRPAASARALLAAFEIARRIHVAERVCPERFRTTADVAAWAMPRLGALAHEELWLLALDGRGRLRAARSVARGGLHGAAVRAADPLRIALRASATAFVLVHNHPSGDATPSAHDVVLTREVAAAAVVVGVPLLDHVVVTTDGFAPVPFDGGAA